MREAFAAGLSAVALLSVLSGCGSDEVASDPIATDPIATDPIATDTVSSAPPESAGTEPASSTAPTTSAPARVYPACSEVWIEGGRLPAGYRGCLQDGARVKPKTLWCTLGNKMFLFGTDFYAMERHPIQRASGGRAGDADFAAAAKSCTG